MNLITNYQFELNFTIIISKIIKFNVINYYIFVINFENK